MVKALIAVRSGSERVTNKNTRAFAGSSLLEIKINQLKRIDAFDGIVVNSNSDYMLKIAKEMGCEVVRRPQIFAEPSTLMSDVYKNIAENFPGDIAVYCNVTNPLIKDESIKNAINMFANARQDVESVNTVHVVKEFLHLDGKPLNYDPLKQPRSQDLPNIYALNFAVNIIAKEKMIEYKNIISPNCKFVCLSQEEAWDIDSVFDFEFADYMYQKKFDAKQ